MGVRLIKDIRLFELDVPNVDGNSLPSYIGKIYNYDQGDCYAIIQRLLFLLRHRGFGFDSFDHLYLNFTPLLPHGEVKDVNRYTSREFSWLHYVDAGCNPKLFNSLSFDEKNSFIIESVKKAVHLKASENDRPLFSDTLDEVLSKGKDLLLPYKQKENPDYSAEIFLRIDDKGAFIPLIRIRSKDGSVKTEQELRAYSRDEFIIQIGTITMGKSSVRITPRKNTLSDYFALEPIMIRW